MKKKQVILAGAACFAASLFFLPQQAAARPHGAPTETVTAQAKLLLPEETDGQKVDTADNRTPKTKDVQPAAAATPSAAQAETTGGADAAADTALTFHAQKVRLMWQVYPGAVRYQVVLMRGAENTPENFVTTMNQIYSNGVEVSLAPYGAAAAHFYWKERPLDFTGAPLADFSAPAPITAGELDPEAPRITTEFEKMDYFPEYPVYSWIPTLGAKHHTVEVYRERFGKLTLLRTLAGGEYDVYEEGGYTTPGRYEWRVRAVDESGAPLSRWSPFSEFSVTTPTPIAALGDSITHGGGAMSVPPGYLIYDWETYCSVPVKNLGYSGNTTAAMLERFERDVLPFSPRVLVIMGGVNDYRGTTFGAETVVNLSAIRDKCDAYGIIPVFLTVTPINPALIARAGTIETPPSDWQVHRAYINHWIMEQPYHIDIASALTDEDGNLAAKYTTDGLHPDYLGKKHIGETVGYFLRGHFAWITDGLTKKPLS